MLETKKVTLADALSKQLLIKRYDRGEAITVEELLTKKEKKQLDKDLVVSNHKQPDKTGFI